VIASAVAAGSSQVDDAEREVRLLLGQRSFENNCLMCHSAELSRQNALSPEQWAAEVDKMINWGAPVPDDERPLLQEFLVSRYGATVARAASARVDAARSLKELPPLVPLSDTADQARGAGYYSQHCLNCHGTQGQGGEPGSNLIEQPVLLEPERFRAVVHGGRGKMPSYAEVLNEAAMDDILAWLRTERYRPFSDGEDGR
jgi:ubiquinol-cytochrome c reductase cytochrome c subunit